MPIFYLDKLHNMGEEFEITDTQLLFHLRAFRLREKESITFFTHGKKMFCKVVKTLRDSIICEVEKVAECTFPEIDISIVQAVIERGSLESVLRLNIPLFVSKFIFFKADRSNYKLNDKIEKRLNQIALSVAEQSEVCYSPYIVYKERLKDALNFLDFGSELFLLDLKSSGNIFSSLNEIKFSKKAAFIVGPEGGFSVEELDFARSIDIKRIKLSSGVFRSEFAGFVASILLRELTS